MSKKPSAQRSVRPRSLVFTFIILLAVGLSLSGLRSPRQVRAQEESQLIPDIVVFSESFDSVTAPALPPGWTASSTGQIEVFRTVTSFPDSPPNAVFTNDPNTQGTAELVSPAIALGNISHKLVFRHFYQTDYEFDGGVLEISINGGGFQDILAAGGAFITGGYDTILVSGTLSSRQAWTGQQAGYITTEVSLPPATNNQSVRFRWRLGTDNMEAGTGWRIDDVQVSNNISGVNANAITIPVSGNASPYPSDITLSNMNGLVTDVQVSLKNFTHNSPDDVDLLLVAPNGTKVVLMSDVGGTNPVNNVELFFSDLAASSLPDNSTITNGTYKPTNFEPGDSFPAPAPAGAPNGNRLSVLNGLDPNGTWKLFLVDDSGNNAGSISGGWHIAVQSSVDAIGIPEIGAAQPYASEKRVAGIPGTVTSATVTLSNFSHTSPDDVDIMLVAPNGRRIVLMSDVGGNTEVGGLFITFDDAAPSTLPDGSPLLSGAFRPTDFEPGDNFPAPAPQGALTGTTMNAFYGSGANGFWKLYAVDDTGANAGSIAGSWSINLQTSTTACAFTLDPTGQTFPITGGSDNFDINMPSTCAWSASTTSGFITIDSSASGNGSGSVSFSVAPNMTGGRTGTIEISNGAATRAFVIQQPSGCPFSLNPAAVNIGAAGGNGNVAVTAGSICGWQATSSSNWVQITSAPQTGDGMITFTVQPNPDPVSRSTTITVGARSVSINQSGATGKKFDFDGDGSADLGVFRPSSGYWYLMQSQAGFSATNFGTAEDKIVPGDYDGDDKTDIAVWRPSSGYWYILNSFDNSLRAEQFGQTGDSVAAGDYDGDGKSDIAVYRTSNNNFYMLFSTDGSFHFQQWGEPGDLPVIADYDGDGKTDFSVFRPSNSTFYSLLSNTGTVRAQQFGQSGDKPLAGDFDGDSKIDIGLFRPSTGGWYYLQSSDNGFRGVAWGTNGDIPATADYDGDGKFDVAIFRPSTGTFYILQSGTMSLRAQQFGTNGDVPVPSAFDP
jgi:hypothetical protein